MVTGNEMLDYTNANALLRAKKKEILLTVNLILIICLNGKIFYSSQ